MIQVIRQETLTVDQAKTLIAAGFILKFLKSQDEKDLYEVCTVMVNCG